MEHISKVLGSLKREELTKHQMNIEPPAETEAVGVSAFGISSLNHTFENFKVLPGTEKAYEAFKAVTEGKGKPFLLCYGGVGNGKTHLLEALALKLREQHRGGILWVVADFLAYLRRLMRDSSKEDVDVVIERYQSGKAVLFDDFGMEYGTNWEMSVMERIINGRYRSRDITVIISNKDLDELPERIVSRFFDPEIGVVVLNQGKDYRRRSKKEVKE